MAKLAMARSAIAVIRFMTFSPFHEASTSDRLQSVKRNSLEKRATHAKLFLGASAHVCPNWLWGPPHLYGKERSPA
jgi:hypothetical protein